MNDLQLITRRREEVADMISTYHKHITELEAELVELETAGKVIARLSNAEWAPLGSANQSPATHSVASSGSEALDKMTMPIMIVRVLEDSYRQGLRGISPKEIGERIREKFSPDSRNDYVASIVWRIWKQGRIEKVGEGLYTVPKKSTDDAAQDNDFSDMLGTESEKDRATEP